MRKDQSTAIQQTDLLQKLLHLLQTILQTLDITEIDDGSIHGKQPSENYGLDAPLWRASFLGRRASDGTRGTRSSMRTNLCSLNVRTFEFIRDAVSTSVPWHLASIAFNIRSAKGSSIRSDQWQVTKDYLHRTGSRAPKKVNWGFGQLRMIWCETYSSCAYRCHMPAALVVS